MSITCACEIEFVAENWNPEEVKVLLVTGYDGSEHGNAALVRADELVSCVEGEHHVMLVAHVGSHQGFAMIGPCQIDLYALEKERLSEAYAKAATSLKVKPTTVVRRGRPARELVAYAEKAGADFIVVGSRGRGGLKSLLRGSTSHGTIRGAPCEVIVV